MVQLAGKGLGQGCLIASLLVSSSLVAARQTGLPPKPQGHTAEDLLVLESPGSSRVLIHGGVFRMGQDVAGVRLAQQMCRQEPLGHRCKPTDFVDETEIHDVQLSDFWIDRREVTSAAYRRCVAVGACQAPAYSAAQAWTARDDHPVTLVSWFDAVDYCTWIGGRLPTEAEWERAAKGWSRRLYPWGQLFNPLNANHGRWARDPLDDSDGFLELAPVGSFPQGRTREGIDDLAGNVEEWVADWYAPQYPSADVVDPKGPQAGDERVIRGGSFIDGRAWLRTTARRHDLPSTRRAWRGFRCVREHRPRQAP